MASTFNPTTPSQLEDVSAPSTSASAKSATKPPLPRNKRYHVFLSFRGPDVRDNLVKNLFRALEDAGLNVFLDSEKLEKGEIIKRRLEEGITSSLIRIPIFSKGYADSTWCLREAALICSTPGLVMPLFYHVEPTHVRFSHKDESPYKQSFDKHYGRLHRHPRQEVDAWKDALGKICDHSGWSIDRTEGSENSTLKSVVNDLLKKLESLPLDVELLDVAKHPVGLDATKNALIQTLKLNEEDKVVKVGIWGIGGVGKTTVAKAVYNEIYCYFEAHSFVSNVDATAEVRGLMKLQKQILRELVKYDGKVYDVDKGKTLLRDLLRGLRVLLILDDVTSPEQLDALVENGLRPGSRVLITSRNKHILNVANVPLECIHEMTGLKGHESLNLFSWHAFQRASPSPGFELLSREIVNACVGHPLSLEVTGSSLQDKQDNIGCWKEALENITLNPSIHGRLKISYNSLSDDEKEIFVDIACLFIGEDKELPIIFWKSLQYKMVETAVENLSMKSLIKIDSRGRFYMHDHLRDMGRTIAGKEKEGSRIWRFADFRNVPDKTKVSRLRLTQENVQSLEMLFTPGLRYLHLKDLLIEDVTEETIAMLPKTLIWLRLQDCEYAIGTDRATKKPSHSSRFVGDVWQLKIAQLKGISWSGMFPISSLFALPNIQIEHMDLQTKDSHKLKKLPDAIGNLTKLRHLDLKPYLNLISLPHTIGNMSQLQQLDLTFCCNIGNLPESIGDMSQLQHLGVKRCRKLTRLPDRIGNLSQLQQLDLGFCVNLENLPDSIGKLSQLQQLNLSECFSLKGLPHTIGDLSNLQHLSLEKCAALDGQLHFISKLSQLRELNLRWCIKLQKLPDNIGNLSQLQHLYLTGCKRLENLPDTIGDLSQLKHLDLRECYRLNNLPDAIGDLSQLESLDLIWCDRLSSLPDTIGKLSQLKSLYWRGRKTWKEVMEGRNERDLVLLHG